ncbi:MAG: MlaD family protein [Ignavibacteria bacterium]|nr:MlaD family protein [Ignavibacteria bacterium]
MKESRKTNIKVGITVLIAVLVLIWILGWAKSITVAGNYYSIKMRFNSVSGLEVGDHITINGVKKGKVESIELNGNYVIVTGLLPNEVILKRDAIARVEMFDLMGGKKIDIIPGNDEIKFDLNQELKGDLATDIPGTLRMLGDVEADLKIIVKDVRSLLVKIDETFINDETFSDVKTSLKNLEKITTQLNQIISQNRSEIDDLLRNSSELTQNINSLVNKNAEDISVTVNESKNLLKKVNELTEKFDKFITEIQSNQNNIGKLIYDEKFYQELTNSIDRLNQITELLLNQLKEDGIKVDTKIRLFK